MRIPIWSCSRWGLQSRACYQPRGALLPHHFTLTENTNTSAVSFLLHFPSAHAVQSLAGTLPIGARTFLRNPRDRERFCELPRLPDQLQRVGY